MPADPAVVRLTAAVQEAREALHAYRDAHGGDPPEPEFGDLHDGFIEAVNAVEEWMRGKHA